MTITAELIAKLEVALREARAFIASEQALLLAGVADPGPDGTPDRSSIHAADQAAVDGFDQALAKIDAALANGDVQP